MPFNLYVDAKNGPSSYSDDTQIMVRNESELTKFKDVKPGSIAYTAGYKKMWQKDSDGNWVALEV